MAKLIENMYYSALAEELTSTVVGGVRLCLEYSAVIDTLFVSASDGSGNVERFRIEPATYDRGAAPSVVTSDDSYARRDEYTFAQIQGIPYGNGSRDDYLPTLYGDYKEWSRAELNTMLDSMLRDIASVARYRMDVRKLVEEYASAAREPDLNVMADVHRSIVELANHTFANPDSE